MAKVSSLKYELNGVEYVTNVNCNSSGTFKANPPKDVAERLNLRRELCADTLTELEKDFYAAIEKYKKASIQQELLLAIRYGAGGRFREEENGDILFEKPFSIRLEWSHESDSCLLFDFDVIMKETVDTAVNYYTAKQGKDFPHWNIEENENPDKWYKDAYSKYDFKVEKYKLIPFSETAFESLKNAQEKIRKVSELLYKFISQDEKMIEDTLTKTKLLN